MTNRIHISVTGTVGSGKTAVVGCIKAALESQGFQNITVIVPDGDLVPPESGRVQARLQGVLTKQPVITIEEKIVTREAISK